MVIIKATKCWQTNSNYPNENYTEHPDSDIWVVDDDSELGQRIMTLGTRWMPVLDGDQLVGVVDTDPGYDDWAAQQKLKKERIKELKSMLRETDYAVIKIAEGAATVEEYAKLISDREAWRLEINELGG